MEKERIDGIDLVSRSKILLERRERLALVREGDLLKLLELEEVRKTMIEDE